MIRSISAEPVVEAHAQLGEGPVWHAEAGVLDWVDCPAGAMHRFDPRTGTDTVFFSGPPIGSFAHRRAGGHVVASGRGLHLLQPDGDELQRIATIPDDVVGKFNDGKVDALGRFWAGTSTWPDGGPNGGLLRLDPDHSLHSIFGGVIISNGIDWDDDGARMVYVDSFAGGVDVVDLDFASGSVVQRRRLAEVVNDTASPFGFTVADGLALDVEGGAWVAIHGTGEVRRYTRDGGVDAVVQLPTLGATSVAFGGATLEDLYITSASVLPADHAHAHHLDGALFVCRPGVAGRAMHMYAG